LPDLSQRLQHALGDRYRIERELGRGGMATVFLAEDLRHHRRVAIKLLDPEVAAAIGPERFLREIETVAGLSHPHILPLHDSGQAGGLLFYVMPCVEGGSLRERLAREQQLPVDVALRLTREIAAALDHAHRQGIVHRDVKPENILLQDGQALVADFGVARAAAAGGAKLTATGVSVGTPMYMSPEQAAGGAVDARADQYGLGCVLYEMLAGEAPFTGPTAESIVFQHLNAAPPRVSAMRPAAPAGLDAVLAKALAKSPADRYATTAELVAALDTAQRSGAAPARARWRGAPWVAAALAGVLVLVAVAAWRHWWPFGGSPAPAVKKDWILVAEFDGPPGDSTLAPAARSLLSAALDQSRIVATVPPDQVRQALRSAGKPPGTRVDAELAQELAYRSAVRAVLEGTISRLGKGYAIVLKVVDADTSRVLITRSGTARDDDSLIPALGQLAKQLRQGLGENRAALAAARPMTLVATPSFEAYRIYAEALERYRLQTGNRDLLRRYRAALDLDPGFASARMGMAYPYLNLGYSDSARACIEEALRHPERLSERMRERAEITLAGLDGDYGRAVAAWDRILADDPGNVYALAQSNDDLWAVGRNRDALDRTRRAMELSPFGPSEGMRINETFGLARLGRYPEAREANQRQTGIYKIGVGLWIELMDGRHAAAESLARANLDDPRLTDDNPEGTWPGLAAARFARGAVTDAAGALASAIDALERRHDLFAVDWFPRWWTEFRVWSDGAFPPPPRVPASDTSARAVVVRGLEAVAARDVPEAQRCLAILRRHPPRDLARDRLAVPLIEARLAALAGRPEEAVRLLRPFATPTTVDGVSLVWARWWLADAFEQTGRPDSAAWWLEHVQTGVDEGAAARAYVERRLALLDAKQGRIADAERHLAVAEKTWDQPDPAVRRMLDEARTAVRTARAMSGPERPRR